MHLRRRRLVPGCLADNDLLDEVTDDRHQLSLRIFILAPTCLQHKMALPVPLGRLVERVVE
jgi:hypothetical protein